MASVSYYFELASYMYYVHVQNIKLYSYTATPVNNVTQEVPNIITAVLFES